MKRTLFLGIAYLSIILNLIMGFIILLPSSPDNSQKEDGSSYPLLAPRIFAEKTNDVIVNFVPLRGVLNSYDKGNTNQLGIYFEYLPSGVSIGINDKNNFVIASLLKVPLAMGVFKQIELGQIKDDDILTVQKDDLDPGFGTFWEKGVGAKVTVKQALKLALQESDNTASNVLLHNVASGVLSDVFDYLDIPKELDSQNPVVTPKNYSSILRSLYLSSYLSPKYSSELLDIMTGSIYNDKMRAPIPPNIKVAHKIGVHETNDPNESVYTDCGIVYIPKRPYILCIMARDESEKNATHNMNEISNIVYQYVSTVNKNK